jgi:glyoxylase-like metal-dependent hydrolase (beta-lactamase superfamily II)
VGGFTVTTVHDGVSRRPVEGFVRNAPLAEVQAVLAESFMPTDTLTIPFTVTFVETPQGLVVFDAGTGGQLAPTRVRCRQHARGRARPAAVRDGDRAATSTGDHHHWPHAAQNAVVISQRRDRRARRRMGPGSPTPATRRARPRDQRGTSATFAPLRALIQGPGPARSPTGRGGPGIRRRLAHWHTPGTPSITWPAGNAQMMFLADLTNRPSCFARPDFQSVFDFDGEMAATTRRRIFDRVSADRMRVTGYHYPFPSQGFIAREGEGYRFMPGDWSSAV